MNQDELNKRAEELIEKIRFTVYGCPIESSTPLEIECATECAILAQQMVVDALNIKVSEKEDADNLVLLELAKALTEAQSLLTILKEKL